MEIGYAQLFNAVGEYIYEYEKNGYNELKKRRIFAIISDYEGDEPLARLFTALDCDCFERAVIITALLCNSDIDTFESLKLLCKSEKPTMRFFCALFTDGDIINYLDYFAENSLLSRFIFKSTKQLVDYELSLEPRISDYVFSSGKKGIFGYIMPLDKTRTKLTKAQLSAVNSVINSLNEESGIPELINLYGASGVGRHSVLSFAGENVGCGFIEINIDLMPDNCLDEIVKHIVSESVITASYPVIRCDIPADGDKTKYGEFRKLILSLEKELRRVFVISDKPITGFECESDIYNIKIPFPSLDEQCNKWAQESNGTNISADFGEITSEFNFSFGAIEKAFRFAKRSAQNNESTISTADIKKGCYYSANADMGQKATLISCSFSMDDLILPKSSKDLLSDACNRVRYKYLVYEKWNFGSLVPYGRGVSMIFSGPPGTGKTMAAQVVAQELGLEVYRVDLSAVVSKYIGETEKNLREIFENAEKCKVVLFFDEADVLFGKRTEVKDSNDKYSNMEAAYLLQKIEEYDGVAILATNYIQNFDEAFKRRIKFLIEFPFPGKDERLLLWKRFLGGHCEDSKIDYDFLSEKFELSGSNIKNIVLYSAFLAAGEKSGSINMKHIILALKNEYNKSGVIFTSKDAGEYRLYLE